MQQPVQAVQAVQEHRAGEGYRQETAAPTTRQGVPAQEALSESRQAKEPELIYREENSEEAGRQPVQDGQEHHTGEDRRTEAEKIVVRQGMPARETVLGTRQAKEPELAYREAGPEETGQHPVQTMQMHYAGEDSRSRPEALPQSGAVPGPQPLSTAIPIREHDMRTLPGMQGGLVYRENGEQGPGDPAAAALQGRPAAFRPGVRDIRILNQRVPEQRPKAVPSSSAEDSELSYLPAPEAPAAAQQREQAGAALPQWAQRLLEKPAGPDARQGGRITYSAPPQAQQQAPGRQIQWTAPAATPRPADITYHAKPPAEAAQPAQPAALSDRELRRAADKIYRMIEERLRRELRRSGR